MTGEAKRSGWRSLLRGLAAAMAMCGAAVGFGPAVWAEAPAAPAANAVHAAADHGEAPHAEGAHAGEHAHLGEAGVNREPQEFRGDLAIWSFVVFLLLLAILTKFAWGPLARGLEAREHRIAAEIAAAHKANDDAKQMLAQYEARLTQAQEEVRGIMDEARRDAERTAQEIVGKARQDASSEIERGKREIELATGAALNELANRSANLAVDLAGRILRTNLQAADQSRLIEEAVAAFPKTAPSKN